MTRMTAVIIQAWGIMSSILIISYLLAVMTVPVVSAFSSTKTMKFERQRRSSFLLKRRGDSGCFLRSVMGSGVEDGKSTAVVEKEKEDAATLLETICLMRVKELKMELTKRKISTSDVFDKEELVKRLFDSRLESPATIIEQQTDNDNNHDTNNDIIRGDISFTSIETGRTIPGTSLNSGETIRIDAEGTPYPTITIHVLDNDEGGRGGRKEFDLTLLLDTACSGFVLRPSSVQKYNMKSSTSSSSTMIGAGGTAGSTTGLDLTQINSFTILGDTKSNIITYNNNGRQQPFPVAVQDIGALPTSLDGIIGLSFMNQFACTEIDIDNSKITFYKKETSPPIPSHHEIIAEGNLSPTRLGIWTVDTMIDGRGPIKMLVDTGATSTFINWKGVVDGLSLSRNSFLVKELQQRTGAMGSDNIAMDLTHRIDVENNINFVNRDIRGGTGRGGGRGQQQYDGICSSATTSSQQQQSALLSIDIGDIAILDSPQLSSDRVVGILGMDFFLQCSMMRMNFNGVFPKITLFKNNNNNNNKTKNDSATAAATPPPPPATVATTTTETVVATKEKETTTKKRKKRPD
jgi:hypothetical protein